MDAREVLLGSFGGFFWHSWTHFGYFLQVPWEYVGSKNKFSGTVSKRKAWGGTYLKALWMLVGYFWGVSGDSSGILGLTLDTFLEVPWESVENKNKFPGTRTKRKALGKFI